MNPLFRNDVPFSATLHASRIRVNAMAVDLVAQKCKDGAVRQAERCKGERYIGEREGRLTIMGRRYGFSGLVVVVLLVVSVVFLLTACGSGEDATTTTTTEAMESTTTSGTSPAADEEYDLGVDVIKIANISPYSGPFGFFGQWLENSLQIEADRINAAGGLGGAQIEIIGRDMELNPQLAVQAAQEVSADPDVYAVVGPAFTGFWNATKSIFTEGKVISFATAVGGVNALEDAPYGFRTQDSFQDSLMGLLNHLELSGVKSIGMVYEGDDSGKSLDELLKAHASEFGMQYLGLEVTRPDDQTHRAQVEKMKDAGAILISGNATSAAKSAAAAGETEYAGRLVGLSGLGGYTYVEGAGDFALGTIFAGQSYIELTDVPMEDWPEGERDHMQKLLDQYGTVEGPATGVIQPKGSKNAADALVLFAMAVEKAKSLDPDAIKAALETLDVPAGVLPSGVHVQYGPDDHESYSSGDIWVYEWSKHADGSWYLKILSRP